MGDSFAVEVFDPSLLLTNLGKVKRHVPVDRVAVTDPHLSSNSYLFPDDEERSEHDEHHAGDSSCSNSADDEDWISRKIGGTGDGGHGDADGLGKLGGHGRLTLIYRMFHVTSPGNSPKARRSKSVIVRKSSSPNGRSTDEDSYSDTSDDFEHRVPLKSGLPPTPTPTAPATAKTAAGGGGEDANVGHGDAGGEPPSAPQRPTILRLISTDLLSRVRSTPMSPRDAQPTLASPHTKLQPSTPLATIIPESGTGALTADKRTRSESDVAGLALVAKNQEQHHPCGGGGQDSPATAVSASSSATFSTSDVLSSVDGDHDRQSSPAGAGGSSKTSAAATTGTPTSPMFFPFSPASEKHGPPSSARSNSPDGAKAPQQPPLPGRSPPHRRSSWFGSFGGDSGDHVDPELGVLAGGGGGPGSGSPRSHGRRPSSPRMFPNFFGGGGGGDPSDSTSPGPKSGLLSPTLAAAVSGFGNKVRRSRSVDRMNPKLNRSNSEVSLSEKYGRCQEVLGKGAHAVVQLAHKKDMTAKEKLYAVKKFRKRRKDELPREYIKKLTAEFCIASTLRHENVCETVDLIQDENSCWCEVMEYCPGGDLFSRIKIRPLSNLERDCYFKQLIHGIAYLHSVGVAHRDIKPENLLLDASGHILKIADFGISEVFRTMFAKDLRKSTGLCGSEPYIAPEEFVSPDYFPGPVDIWAAGIVYYTMVNRAIPWLRAEAADARYSGYAGNRGVLVKEVEAGDEEQTAAEAAERAPSNAGDGAEAKADSTESSISSTPSSSSTTPSSTGNAPPDATPDANIPHHPAKSNPQSSSEPPEAPLVPHAPPVSSAPKTGSMTPGSTFPEHVVTVPGTASNDRKRKTWPAQKLDLFVQMSAGAANVLFCMLDPNPKSRWTAQDIKCDPWFADVECCYQCHWNAHHEHQDWKSLKALDRENASS